MPLEANKWFRSDSIEALKMGKTSAPNFEAGKIEKSVPLLYSAYAYFYLHTKIPIDEDKLSL